MLTQVKGQKVLDAWSMQHTLDTRSLDKCKIFDPYLIKVREPEPPHFLRLCLVCCMSRISYLALPSPLSENQFPWPLKINAVPSRKATATIDSLIRTGL